MRLIYRLLIGLILFNAVLFIFAQEFFPATSEGQDAIDPTNITTYSDYEQLEEGAFAAAFTNAIFVSSFILGGSVLAGLWTKNLALWIGIGAFMSVLIALWNVAWGTVVRLTGEYEVVSYFITVMSIIIGILAVLTVVEILTGQRGLD